ncbi:MAG: hypothetical protein AB2697_04410 [Candidatus Thiodiazotropha endolucinida]
MKDDSDFLHKLKITQADAAEALGLSLAGLKKGLSRDKRYLNEVRIQKLYKYLSGKGDKDKAQKLAFKAEKLSPGIARILTEGASFVDNQDRLVGIGQGFIIDQINNGSHVDLWLIGPAYLPVIDNEKVQQNWIKNLKVGVDYHILWFLDQLDQTRVQSLSSVLANLSETIRADDDTNGRIFHYGTYIIDEREDLTRSKQMFERLENKLEKTKVNRFCVFSQEQNRKLRQFRYTCLLTWQKSSSIAVYDVDDVSVAAQANIKFENLKTTLDSEETVSPMFWFTEEEAESLASMLFRVRQVAGECKDFYER